MINHCTKLPYINFCIIILYGEVDMEFFREHKKVIVGVIAVSFIIWTFGMAFLLLLPNFGG